MGVFLNHDSVVVFLERDDKIICHRAHKNIEKVCVPLTNKNNSTRNSKGWVMFE